MTGLHFDEEYTLTEKRPADGYAVADDIVFRLERKTDADGHELDEADVYYLKDKKKLWIIPWEEWALLDDATVIMKDDITRVQISKVDIATGKELPGAELVIKDTDGNTVAPVSYTHLDVYKRQPRVKQKSAFPPGRMTSWRKAQTVT